MPLSKKQQPLATAILEALGSLLPGQVPPLILIEDATIVAQVGCDEAGPYFTTENLPQPISDLKHGPLKSALQKIAGPTTANDHNRTTHSIPLDDEHELVSTRLGSDDRSRLLVKLQKTHPLPQPIVNHDNLSRQVERLNEIASASDVMIWETGVDGGLTYLSESALSFVGRSMDELSGHLWREFVHPEDSEKITNDFEVSTSQMQMVQTEYRLRRYDGQYFWFLKLGTPRLDDQSKFLGYIGFCLNVSKFKQNELELETRKQLFELALSGSTIGIWEGDVLREDWIMADDIERTLGYDNGELKNSRAQIRNLIHPDDIGTTAGAGKQPFSGKSNISELRLKTKSGGYRWYRVFGKSEKDASGKVTRIAGAIIDIDRLKTAELAAELQVRRRDEYLAMLSHELRNPMTAINFAAAGLEASSHLTDDWNQFVSVVSNQTLHMSRLLDDLLDVARVTQNKLEIVPVMHDIAKETAITAQGILPVFEQKQQTLHLDIPHTPLLVYGDPARLKQAVTNLLDNASKYTKIGGEIWLSVVRENDWITITVNDSGIGIEPDQLTNIFDLFYQETQPKHRRPGGMGVGLFLVKQIAEVHHGEIVAESRGKGLGSKFTLTIPTGQLPDNRQQSSSNQRFNNLKLAFVEDNEDTRKVLSYLLNARGFVVTQFADGETASVEIPKLQPDLAVIDIGLPGMNGFDLAREIRQHENCKDMLLIALSGHGNESDLLKSSSSGFDGHLVKPTRIDTICDLIAEKIY